MRYSFLLLLFSLRLSAQSAINDFNIPEDSHHFIYFLQKEFSKKQPKVTIITPCFSIKELNFTMTKKPYMNFSIYINRACKQSQSIQKLALYQHIDIYLCKQIVQTKILLRSMMLTTGLELTNKALEHQKGFIRRLTSQESVEIPKSCLSY